MIKWLIFKLATLLTYFRHFSIPSKYRFFIRYNYIGRFIQLRYYFNDYILRRPYKDIQFFGEFSPELKFVLPYAYWHYKNGTLGKTISTSDTKELYYFSKRHIERNEERSWNDFNFDIHIPNSEDHNLIYNFRKWQQVPLKKHYKNTVLLFDKPILIIANKYNEEWEEAPINFISTSMLSKINALLSHRYQIIYNRPSNDLIVNDNSKIEELNDHEFISNECPQMINAMSLYQKEKARFNNYNHYQLALYANCESFISVHGGGAVLASYFGGVNIIYSQRGHEAYFNEFDTIYPKLSNAKIIHVKDDLSLIRKVADEYT